MKETFPNRFDIFYGKSDVTIPAAYRKLHLSCDIIVVDGGHLDDQTLKDIVNIKRLSHENSLILVDDTAYGAGYSEPVMASINKLLKCSFINVQFMCSLIAPGEGPRGFSMFTYNHNNDNCIFGLP